MDISSTSDELQLLLVVHLIGGAAVAVAAFFFVSDRRSGRKPREELANLDQLEGGFASARGHETEEQRNKFLVLRLYEALNGRDHAAVHSLLAPDLECSSSFRFQPRSVDAFGSTVIAEGVSAAGEDTKAAYWVHAWTVGSDGVITQLREYFNTDLTVTRLAAAAASKCVWQSRRPDRARNSLPGLVLAL
ncbi:hypothetical protein TRIUR3_05350 [Triticum urartu]|uniref:Wound-induced protein 1 n=1 Tax=Triticum urartu TaxID=4572 RepID=M7Z955_TRIUA|nr:hypothetical protein TRIUR3_05350 [Triticum urartu]